MHNWNPRALIKNFSKVLLLVIWPWTLAIAGNTADSVMTSGKIYTANPNYPWAEAVAIKDGEFVYVGDNEGAVTWLGKDTVEEDLAGKLVLPGMFDSHAHPGLISVFASVDPLPFTVGGPYQYASKEDTLAWLKEYAEDNPDLPVIVSGSWQMAEFGPEGPHKRDLDAIVSDRPVILFSDIGHSSWVNSKTLEVLGISKNTEPATGPSHFYRDETGEPTGYVKEFAIVKASNLIPDPEAENFSFLLKTYLNHMASVGVTTLFDAGNSGMEDLVYSAIAQIEKEEGLPVRVEGSYHIVLPHQIDDSVSELKRLRTQYSGENLNFNTIKIHFDGVQFDINTGAMLEPYDHDANEKGQVIFSEERLEEFMLELHKEKIDLHLHTWGDRATRIALNAYEKAQLKIGGKLDSRLTLTHLIHVDEADKARFKELGVIANYTMHWFNMGENLQDHDLLGDRADKVMPVKSLIKQGARVTFGSDELFILGYKNFSPFTNMQAGMNRQGITGGKEAQFFQPESEKLEIEDLLQGYTINGAYQLRMDNKLGSIVVGKEADLVVMKDNVFDMDKYDLHDAKVEMTMLKGDIIYERTLWQSFKESLVHSGHWLVIWLNS